MIDIQFRVDLVPRGKQAAQRGRGGWVFKPTATRNWESAVAATAAQHIKTDKIIEGPVLVSILAVLPRPDTRRKNNRKRLLKWSPYRHWAHDYKPDIDNIRKSVQDSLKAFWKDDKQVVIAVSAKVVADFDERPHIVVGLKTINSKVMRALKELGFDAHFKGRCRKCGREMGEVHRECSIKGHCEIVNGKDYNVSGELTSS